MAFMSSIMSYNCSAARISICFQIVLMCGLQYGLPTCLCIQNLTMYVRSSMGLNKGLGAASVMLSTWMSINMSIWILGRISQWYCKRDVHGLSHDIVYGFQLGWLT